MANLPAGQLYAGHIPGRVLLGFAAPDQGRPTWTEARTLIQSASNTRLGTPGAGAYERRNFSSVETDGTHLTQLRGMLSDGDSAGVMNWVSFKVVNTDWQGVADGLYPAIPRMFRTVALEREAAGLPPYIATLHHEPWGDGPGITSGSTEAEMLTAMQKWANMQIYMSNQLQDVKHLVAWSCIGNGFHWANATANTTTGPRRDATFPQLLINTFKTNNSVAAVDTYDDRPEYTGQTTYPIAGQVGRTSTKISNWIAWMRSKNCGGLGIGEWGVTDEAELARVGTMFFANRDILGIANYFNSAHNADWDWRLIPDSYAAGLDGAPVDLGGTPLTEGRLNAFAKLLQDSISPANTNAAPTAGSTWMRGVAGDGAANGQFAAFIGNGYTVDIGGTWSDSFEAQTELWAIAPGFEWGSWNKPIDVAIGAIYKSRGESWAQAANGAYDARWTTCLNKIKSYRTGKGTTFIRFAHEFNLGMPWSVSAAEAGNFVAAFRRFRGLQKNVFPEGKLVWCPNVGSGTDVQVLNAFPGATYVDVYGIDSYNAYPAVNDLAGFNTQINMMQGTMPKGIESHRKQAAIYGLPFAICEWSTNGDPNDEGQGRDAPVWMGLYHEWLSANAGSGPGKVLYEVLFNVGNFGTGQYSLWPNTKSPLARDVYKDKWPNLIAQVSKLSADGGQLIANSTVALKNSINISATDTSGLRVAESAVPAPFSIQGPGKVLNIGMGSGQNHFSIQYAPDGSSSIDTKHANDIASGFFLAPYFYHTPDNRVHFQARMDAPKTSGSLYSRSELRELDLTGANMGFNPFAGNHYMSGTTRITHLPPNKPEVVIAQLHNGDADRIAIRTQVINGAIKLVVRINGSAVTPYLRENYVLGESFDWKIEIVSGQARVYYNNMASPIITTNALTSTGSNSWYFKTGMYNQSNETIDVVSEYGAAELSRLQHWHTGWPQPAALEDPAIARLFASDEMSVGLVDSRQMFFGKASSDSGALTVVSSSGFGDAQFVQGADSGVISIGDSGFFSTGKSFSSSDGSAVGATEETDVTRSALPVGPSVGFPEYAAEIVADKPRGLWMLDSNSPFPDYSGYKVGATRSSGEQRHAPLVNGASYSQLLGTNNIATFPVAVFTKGKEDSPFTLEAAMRPVMKGAPGPIQILGNQNQMDGLTINGTVVSFSTKYANTGEARASFDLQYLQNALVTGVHTENRNSLYVNGVLVAEVDISEEQKNDQYVNTTGSLYSGATTTNNMIAVNAVSVYPSALPAQVVGVHGQVAKNAVEAESLAFSYFGVHLPLSYDGKDIFLDRTWSTDADWNTGHLDGASVQGGQVRPELIDGLTVRGTWTNILPIGSTSLTKIYGVNVIWDGFGAVVESSIDDGVTWQEIARGRNIPNITPDFNPADKILQIRIRFEGGLEDSGAHIDNLRMVGLATGTIVGVEGRTISLTGQASVRDTYPASELHDGWGTELQGGTLNIGPDNSSNPIQPRTVEAWIKRTTDANLTTNITGTVYKLGNAVSLAQATPLGEWSLVHFVSDTAIAGNISFSGYAEVGQVVLYNQALSVEEMKDISKSYVGRPSVRISDTNVVSVSEPPEAITVYAYDWSITSGG